MLSQTAEYALRAMVCLATDDDDYVAAYVLAKRSHTPRNYMEKILPGLSAAGLIETRRGFGGGHRLAKDRGEITLLEIVRAVGSLDRVKAAPATATRNEPGLRALHGAVERAVAAATEVLGAKTLDDLVREDVASAPIVEARPMRRTRKKPAKRRRAAGA